MRIAWAGFLCMVLGLPAAGAAERCPECGEGCLPEAYVDALREGAGAGEWKCPAGCVALERVARLRDEPGCVYASPEVETTIRADSTANRTVVMPTAYSNPVGQVTMTGYIAGMWQIEYAVTKNVQIGSMVLLPIYAVGAIPNLKVQARLAEHFELGGGCFLGLGGPYTGYEHGDLLVLFGGHLELSVPLGRQSLTLGLVFGRGGDRQRGEQIDMEKDVFLFPNLAWRWAFHPDWSAMVEVTSVLAFSKGGSRYDDPIFVVLYGVRGHGDILFGDIGFALPLVHGFFHDIWKYTPLGIPYFSIGLKF